MHSARKASFAGSVGYPEAGLFSLQTALVLAPHGKDVMV